MRSSSPSARRYTLAFDPTAEARVAQDVARLSTGLSSELGDELCSLLLVGPFARAEGAVSRRGGELVAALPGYELLVVLRRAPERFGRLLPAISATWSRLLATRVALYAVVEATLAQAPRTRTYFHMGRGQTLELLADTRRPIACAAFAATELDATEADQSLIEGLCALALARLEAPDDGVRLLDRAERAVLACGDAVLLTHGLYASTRRERADTLHRAGAGSALREAYHALATQPSQTPSDAHAARVAAAALMRPLAAGVLGLQSVRTGCARELGAYLRSQAPEPERTGWLAATLDMLTAADARVPRASLLRACIALALGDGTPESLGFAARALAPALDSDAAPADHPAALARALRLTAGAALTPSVAQPFADGALVPVPA